jgi:hypothetical protein
MTDAFEWDRPIVIIGAGRSGSSLLSAILGEHPDVYAAGETSFLVNRLWDAFFQRPEYVSNFRIWNLIKNTNAEWRDMHWYPFRRAILDGTLGSKELTETIHKTEEKRLSECLGRFMADSLIPPELRRRYWSFKEIWNGSSSFPHGWHRHNLAFPRARFIHVVRHPWTWARSYFLLLKANPSQADLLFALSEWVNMVEMACRQDELGSRYILIRLEDFEADRVTTVRSLLSFAELQDSARCHAAAGYTYLPSKGELALPQTSHSELNGVRGLIPLMQHFGYKLPL